MIRQRDVVAYIYHPITRKMQDCVKPTPDGYATQMSIWSFNGDSMKSPYVNDKTRGMRWPLEGVQGLTLLARLKHNYGIPQCMMEQELWVVYWITYRIKLRKNRGYMLWMLP